MRGCVRPGDAVHAVGQKHAVPVDRRRLGQLVGHHETHAVALDGLDRRARRLAIVAPAIHRHAGGKFPLHRLAYEVKFLCAVLHLPRQGRAVRRDDGRVGHARRIGHACGVGGRCGLGVQPRHAGHESRASGQSRAAVDDEIASGYFHKLSFLRLRRERCFAPCGPRTPSGCRRRTVRAPCARSSSRAAPRWTSAALRSRAAWPQANRTHPST